MPAKTQLFVVSSNIVPAPHLEIESDSEIVISFDNGLLSPIEDIVLSNVPPITTAPPIIAKIAKTPTTIRIFFLLPSLDLRLVISSIIFSDISSTRALSFISGFFISLPQSRQNFEFTGIDVPHFQQ